LLTLFITKQKHKRYEKLVYRNPPGCIYRHGNVFLFYLYLRYLREGSAEASTEKHQIII